MFYSHVYMICALLYVIIFDHKEEGSLVTCFGVHAFLRTVVTRNHNACVRNSVFDLDELEKTAKDASEQWDISVTPFLDVTTACELQQRLDQRGIGHLQVACPQPNPSRLRIISTHLDNIPAIADEMRDSYHCVLRVDRSQSMAGVPFPSWPHVLNKIGIDLMDVGDAWISSSSSESAYLVVSPQIVKRCMRLLPKELYGTNGGTGLTVSRIEQEQYMEIDFLEQGETYAPMELSKLDKRALKYQ